VQLKKTIMDTSSKNYVAKHGELQNPRSEVEANWGELLKAGDKPWSVHRPLPLVQAKADHRDF
jgi:hypothetical protein